MREIDTETPVVWPAWCYSGETTTEDATPQQASSPHQTQTINNTTISNSIINNNRGKRKNLSPALISGSSPSSSISTALNQSTLSSIDKMLNDRMMVSINNNLSSNNNNNNNNNSNIDNNNKKFCDNGNNVLNNNNNNSSSNNNLFYETIKQENSLDINLKFNGDLTNNINNNNNNNNNNSNSNNSNNNSIKNERLSPSNNNNNNVNNFNTNGEQSSASRSRSATPSSYPGTPPQGLNSIDLQNSLGMQSQQQQQQQTTASGQRPEIPGRNYSDFMRSLAAKYNNQNDSSNSKNLFFDPRLNINSLKSATKETFPTTPETKKQQTTNAAAAAAVANAAQHLTNMSSLFSGLPFPPGVFTPPIIDMSSTQALITLARAAKEAEIQSILKGTTTNPSQLKRNSNSVNSNNSNISPRNLSPNTQNHLGTPKIPNFQMNPGFSLANFHQQMSNIANSTATSPSNNHNTSNNNNSNSNNSMLNNSNSSNNNGGENVTTTPLDLSSSTLVGKQLRVDDMGSRATVSPVLSTKSNSSETKQTFSVGGGGGGGGGSISSQNLQHAPSPTPSQTTMRRCQAQSEEINSWSVEQVCEFVGGIDICAEYVQNFRDQQIDGTGLPLLTEEHLTNSLGLKLGPALKLKSILAKKLGGPCPCVSCSTMGLNTSSSSNHSGGPVKKEFSTTNSVLNNIPWPSSAESES